MFHRVADRTIHALQERVEAIVDDHCDGGDVTYGDGVLTVFLGDDEGTFVLNKQTPNRQLWWSSPLSGPRRYEFSEGGKDGEGAEGAWTYTRYVDAKDARGGMDAGRDEEFANSKTLGRALCFEIKEVYGLELGRDLE